MDIIAGKEVARKNITGWVDDDHQGLDAAAALDAKARAPTLNLHYLIAL